MLLYIHVPFCRKKCRYCAFASGPYSPEAMQTYVDLLIREIHMQGQMVADTTVQTIYFGGGTPSLLPPNDLERIFAAIATRFDIAPDAEITLEANPDSANNQDYLQRLQSLGINRLSLGVQSLHPKHLELLGRVHSPEQALQTVASARKAGFTNISLDFIWGIPGQDTDNWLGQIEQCAALRPEHLSCYGLSVEPGTPLEQDVARNILVLPDDDTQARMFLEGTELLASHGYHHYEISNYALPGCQSRHNSGYWQGYDYLGLGPSAVSTIGNKRWQNPSLLAAYQRAVEAETLGAESEHLTPENLRNERIMLSLRTAQGLNIKAYSKIYGDDFFTDHSARIKALLKNNLAVIDNGSLALTSQGMLVSNAIIAGFMST